ncbi:MAG: c-type cytochrome [Burkholderiaceae bacterium]|nr:c-type cytochrome [Burkholderiaceae bacterium]
MSSFRKLTPALLLASMLLAAGAAGAQTSAYPGIGRAAMPKEIAAWDIDVRPDFKGLPKGSGSVAKGMQVWESQCASCHGIFGESNEVFAPIVGGTTQDDVKTGRVARLNDAAFPGRTTLMKVSTVSTLWDYINRAMPWTQPKSLSIEEVYGVTAYILNLGGVLPDDFILSDGNIANVQKLLPNRHGTTTAHALWPDARMGRRRPDVMAAACMKDCAGEAKLASFLPDFARDAHGNLAEQNRAVGAQRGTDTGGPAPRAAAAAAPVSAVALAQKLSCVACHGLENKLVGPSFREVSKKYAGRADAVDYIAGKIKAGGSGAWGEMAMPPQALSEADARTIAQWLAGGMKK